MTNQLPAYLQNRQTPKLAQTLAGHLGIGTPPYLSIAGNRLTLFDATGAEEAVTTYDPKIGPYLDCVIVDSLERMSKIFYNKAYDPNASQFDPPACWSDNGIGPSRNAAVPQSPLCGTCPNNAWGSKVSAVSGKGVKACSDYQKLALMIPGDEVIFLLRVPPNSLTNLRNYVNKFTSQPVDMSDVITRISFEPQGIGTLKFDAVAYIGETEHGRREKLITAKATDALVGRTDQPRQNALPAPAAQQQIAHANPEPAAGGALAGPAPFVAQPAAQAAPTQPSTTVQRAPAAFPPASSAGGATPASPSEPATGRRKRRTKAEMEASAQPAGAAIQQPAAQAQPLAPFRPQAAQGGPNGQQPAAGQQQGNFGIQPGVAPNVGLEQTLNSIFGPQS